MWCNCQRQCTAVNFQLDVDYGGAREIDSTGMCFVGVQCITNSKMYKDLVKSLFPVLNSQLIIQWASSPVTEP